MNNSCSGTGLAYKSKYVSLILQPDKKILLKTEAIRLWIDDTNKLSFSFVRCDQAMWLRNKMFISLKMLKLEE